MFTIDHTLTFLLLDHTYLCLAVLNGVLCVIFLHGRSSPQASPSATPCLTKSMSFDSQVLEEEPDKLLAPMHYARSGLGTAALNGRLIAAGQWVDTFVPRGFSKSISYYFKNMV